MSAAVTAILNERGRANADRLRVVKLALLHDDLVALDGRRSGGAGFGAVYDAIRGRVAADVLARATPFLWYAVDRTALQQRVGAGAFRQNAEYLLEAMVDSLFDWLPEGEEFRFAPAGRECVLPQLRLCITGASTVGFTRRGPRRVRLVMDGTPHDVDAEDVPLDLSLPALAADGHRCRLLLVAAQSLFPDSYRARIVPGTPQAPRLAQTIGASLDLIASVDPARCARIEQEMEWYIPIASHRADTHNSFSVCGLYGVIFLSEAYDDLRLAEAIVHEYHHNELYLLQESEPICETVDGELVYSPWRSDPRPLDGLLHALHVFSGVAEFLRHAELLAVGERVGILRERRLDVAQKLHLALGQVRHDRLSSSGAALVRSVTMELEDHARELGRAAVAHPSELMIRRIERWTRENPGLADGVRMPREPRPSPVA